METNYIIDQSINFVEEADKYYWKIRDYKIEQYKITLKKPKKAVKDKLREIKDAKKEEMREKEK